MMADYIYEDHYGELGEATGGRSPRPVRRSKQYEDLVVKQLRKTSRQFCLETAYACDRQNIRYGCEADEMHQHTGQDNYCQNRNKKTVSYSSEETRMSRCDAQNITVVSMEPDCQAGVSPVRRARPALGEELTYRVRASPLRMDIQAPLITSVTQSDQFSQRQMPKTQLGSPAAEQSLTNAACCVLSRKDPLECEAVTSDPHGLKCDVLSPSTASCEHGTSHSGDFTRKNSCSDNAAVNVLAERETRGYKPEHFAGLLNEGTTCTTDDANCRSQTHVKDKCTSIVVQRELRITEVLRHRSFNNDQLKSETSGSECHSSDGELTEDDDSPNGNEDGSDSGTGIEVYRPDHPSVLRRKIDDLEGQIQDLQEANVATYAEVLRLQQENDILRQRGDGSRAQLNSFLRSKECGQRDRDSDRDSSRSRLSSSTVSISSLLSSKLPDGHASPGSSKTVFRAGEENIQNEKPVEDRNAQQPVATPEPCVLTELSGGQAIRRTGEYIKEVTELASPNLLRPARLTFDDEHDDYRNLVNASPLEYTSAKTFSHELDVSKLRISSSDTGIGFGAIRSPSAAMRTLVPRSPADICPGDAVKYTRHDGRVGRGYVRRVGWCYERKRMCVTTTNDPPDGPQPFANSSSARRETDDIVPFEKVLLIWKKGLIY